MQKVKLFHCSHPCAMMCSWRNIVVNMAVLVLKMTIFQIFGHEHGHFTITFMPLFGQNNNFHLITTSFYDVRFVLSQKNQTSKIFFDNPLEQSALGANWVSKEAENFKELKFFGLVRCFSVKTEKSSKTS